MMKRRFAAMFTVTAVLLLWVPIARSYDLLFEHDQPRPGVLRDMSGPTHDGLSSVVSTGQTPSPAVGPQDLRLFPKKELQVPRGVRVMFFSPHPDDETLAAGGLIQRVLDHGGEVCIVFITNGDGFMEAVQRLVRHTSTNDFIAYGEQRHAEAVEALCDLGLQPDDGLFLGFPDDGIDDLWTSYWSSVTPYTSPYTRFNRPQYKESISRRVRYAGVDLKDLITRALREFSPDWVVMPDPRDAHPDHCTTGVFVLDALHNLNQEGALSLANLQVLTYLVHYMDYPASTAWMNEIMQSGVGGTRRGGGTLPVTRWLSLTLTSEEMADKQRALWSHQSQIKAIGEFLNQFMRSYELFGQLDAAQALIVPMEYAARLGRPSS